MRRRARQDGNTAELDQALEAMGWLVVPMHHVGGGFPDRLLAKAGRVALAEYKDGSRPPSARKLNARQRDFHSLLAGAGIHVHVFECVADLAQLDRDARSIYERIPPRDFYEDRR